MYTYFTNDSLNVVCKVYTMRHSYFDAQIHEDQAKKCCPSLHMYINIENDLCKDRNFNKIRKMTAVFGMILNKPTVA